MSRSSEPVVTLDDVGVEFSSTSLMQTLRRKEAEVVRAVDGVSLDIHENEVIVLVGESGCGKTTLGKTAVGLQRPSDGSVRYRGQDIWDAKDGRGDVDIPFADIRRSLQIIHQDPGSSLNPNRTILSSLSVPLKKWYPNLSVDDREERIYKLLDYVGMKPASSYASRYPHQLSGGEQQRVALGRALLMNPDVILADEAVSALDVSLRIEMMDLMHDLQREVNTSYLFISHDLANAYYFAEKVGGRIGIMYLGNLVEIGDAEEIIRNPKHPYTKILRWATPVMDPDAAREGTKELPMRKIDIPDPKHPPSGCRFHTRCPKAREVCTTQVPQLTPADESGRSDVACFRSERNHEYWNSEPLPE
ncbi:ABC transporter ATP-binding protein [Natronosalvus caseinilyticus]|uniref:ABC transporter ATP-binding protein n=1 Tax=Natronosalvus caseinilyticus TaxID=2953747 RepID=UPI0028AB7263|nr:ABC transporter ATP-binding protein [Natronosalvus caseinilyticus]